MNDKIYNYTDRVTLNPKELEKSNSLACCAQDMKNMLLELLPNGRGKSLAITKLDEMYMWAEYSLNTGAFE